MPATELTPMRPSLPVKSAGLTITDPLVLYRTLLSTDRIRPDPSQHRLAIHLQTLYTRLKDYEPHIEYAEQLKQISRAINELQSPINHGGSSDIRDAPARRAFSALLRPKRNDSLSLMRVLSSHEGALEQNLPRGLLVHGEVGTGKSMLVDLLAESLPTRKKRRWHFNTFMLETFARLERIRRSQDTLNMSVSQASLMSIQAEEYSILQIVRDMIYNSPIVFLDEFQLPDRATSRILSNMLTLFFQLGGVLVATSNRMPEELAEASGMEYTASPSQFRTIDGGFRRIWQGSFGASGSSGLAPEKSDSLRFLEVLKARCEVWQMEGRTDWRRSESRDSYSADASSGLTTGLDEVEQSSKHPLHAQSQLHPTSVRTENHAQGLPDYYHVPDSSLSVLSASFLEDENWERCLRKVLGQPESLQTPIQWQPSQMQVYGRTVSIPRASAGVSYWTFAELCGTDLGPADYISLASRYHTLVLVDVPIISFLQRNEARRFITLLDALYEARCRLLVRAAAGPDDIFFPGSKPASTLSAPSPPSAHGSTTSKHQATAQEPSQKDERRPTEGEDAIYSETFSEIHQDLTSPFRPNISSYSSSSSSSSKTKTNSAPVDPADEDSDFGPLHPGRAAASPDFTRGASAFLGEDERFAYKRAESRLWEMCGARWWARHDSIDHTTTANGNEEGLSWWKPVPEEARFWERPLSSSSSSSSSSPSPSYSPSVFSSSSTSTSKEHNTRVEGGDTTTASRHMEEMLEAESPLPDPPLPTNRHPNPPKFSWVHAWGMTRWGKKAGKWGQGVDGLEKK